MREDEENSSKKGGMVSWHDAPSWSPSVNTLKKRDIFMSNCENLFINIREPSLNKTINENKCLSNLSRYVMSLISAQKAISDVQNTKALTT